MRVRLVDLDGKSHNLTVSGDECHASIPVCRCGGYRIRGTGITHHDHDTHYAGAICVECGTVLGTLACTVETIFGIEEDQRVLGPSKRWRVY